MKKIVSILVLTIFVLELFGAYAKVNAADESITWTDFSNAKYEIDYSAAGGSNIKIKGVEGNNSRYYWFITSTNTKPEFDKSKIENYNVTYYNSTTGNITVNAVDYLELNQDMYLWLVESKFVNGEMNYNFVIEGEKIERTGYYHDYRLFSENFHISSTSDLIVLENIAWGKHKRGINLKIGKISNNTLLNNLKSNASGAFDSLLQYSKTATTIYNNKIMSSSNETTYFTGYNTYYDDSNVIQIPQSSFENGAYYFIYVELDDENGKYYPVEGVSLGKVQTYNTTENPWYIFPYGNKDFSWENTPASSGGSSTPDEIKSDIDPYDYITFPTSLWFDKQDKKVTSKLTISNKITNYSLYYQYVVIDKATKQKILAQIEELEKDKTKIKELETAYKEKQKESATSDETKAAITAYNEAVAAYNAKVKNLDNLVPKYNDASWLQSSDGSLGYVDFLNNYSLTDEVEFALWVKLVDGENTYYDYGLYSLNGTKTSSSGTSATITADSKGATDSTVATTALPYAGENVAIIAIAAIVMASAILYRKKYKDLKEVK